MNSPGPVFPWFDEHYLAWRKPDPLAVAARALALSEYHHATAQNNGDSNAWLTYGLASAATALASADGLSALGLLLTGLETLVPDETRAKWPLHDVAVGQIAPRVVVDVYKSCVEPAIGCQH